jgi:hypothetical protein
VQVVVALVVIQEMAAMALATQLAQVLAVAVVEAVAVAATPLPRKVEAEEAV